MKFKRLLVLFISICMLSINVDASRGCCSQHNGVSHCDTSIGKYRFNDGTVSPSCVCEGIVQTTKRKTTKKQTTVRPTPKRTTVKTATARISSITTSTTSHPDTVTAIVATESITLL